MKYVGPSATELHEVTSKIDFEIDEYGSLHRPKEPYDAFPRMFEDLTKFDSYVSTDCHIIPVSLPCNVHHYWDEDMMGLCADAFAVQTQTYQYMQEIRGYLSTPGIHYVQWLECHAKNWDLRVHSYRPGCQEYDRAFGTRKTVSEIVKRAKDTKVKKQNFRFPHACPKCSAPAFIGFLQIDCSRACH